MLHKREKAKGGGRGKRKLYNSLVDHLQTLDDLLYIHTTKTTPTREAPSAPKTLHPLQARSWEVAAARRFKHASNA